MHDRPPILASILDGLTSEFINPHGFFVYLLWDDKGEVFYVGSSENVHGRIGFWVRYWGTTVCEVEMVRCTDRAHMRALEKSLIEYYEPVMNTMHIKFDQVR